MRRCMLSIFLLIAAFLQAQTNTDSEIFGADPPLVVPGSPEAGTLGRYGTLPLNSATGQMNLSVPLHTISVDGHNWPITLRYNYGGLILEGKPSLAGLGWSLSANGAVTREVRGLPDEHDFGYYSDVNDIKGHVYDHVNGGMDAWSLELLREKFFKGKYDSEVDKYNVNVAGLSFSFKIGLDGRPVFLSKHANKVSIRWNSIETNQVDSFEVTDTNGLVYTFAEIERSIPQLDEELTLDPITSWNLSSVRFINGQTIDLHYISDTYTDYSFSASGAIIYADIQEDLVDHPIYVDPSYGERISTTTIERKLLKSISFPKGAMTLGITEVEGRHLYNKVTLSDGAGNVIDTYDLTYMGVRDNLMIIEKNGLVHYKFDYHGVNESGAPSIPPFKNGPTDKPLAKDDWKFYNGRSNSYALNIPNSQYLADKEPSFLHTRLGAMKGITYPTKGRTEVTYEQNQVKTDFIADSEYYHDLPAGKKIILDFEGDYLDPTAPQHKEVTSTHTFLYPTVATISHYVTGRRWDSHIVMTIERTDGEECGNGYQGLTTPSYLQNYYDEAPWLRDAIQQNDLGGIDIPFFCPKLGLSYGPDDSSSEYDTEADSSGGKILIMPGTYTFTIYTDFNRTTDASANLTVQLYGGYNEAPPTYANKDVGGIRVSKLTDITSSDSGPSVTRTFDYDDADDISTGSLYAIPQYKEVHKYSVVGPGGLYYREVHTFLESPFTVSDISYGTPIFYETVTERNGDLGRTERHYSFPAENLGATYPKRPRGVDMDKAVLERSDTYVRSGSTASLQRSTDTDHTMVRHVLDAGTLQDPDPNHPWSLKVVKKQDLNINFNVYSYDYWPPPGPETDAVKNLYQVIGYKEVDNWQRPSKTTDTMVEGGSTMTSVSNYEYDFNGAQQLIRQTTTDSNGETLEKQFLYPGDIADTTYDAMEANNQVAQPVLVKSLGGGVLIGQRETTFISNGQGYRPYQLNIAKGEGAMESKLRYTYDGQGRIQEVIRMTGELQPTSIPSTYYTSYLWGYTKEYPVAKVEGATYSELMATGVDLTIINDLGSTDDQKRAELQKIRDGLPQAMVTTYTYQPLVGVTSVTDPKGYVTYYEYDDQHRLKQTLDANLKILETYDHNYRSQH